MEGAVRELKIPLVEKILITFKIVPVHQVGCSLITAGR
jgi:hypothetical protein